MRNVYLYIGLFIMLGISSFGQNLQNVHWYFGANAGLDFSTGTGVNLADIPWTSNFGGNNFAELEGSAVISSKQGDLLFYSNGEEIFNVNHASMYNGLLGSKSSSQNVIIVPKPLDDDNFYVVTIDGWSGNNSGLHYVEVDMTLNSGLGGVITTFPIPLKDNAGVPVDTSYYVSCPTCPTVYNYPPELITSTLNSDGINYWIVAQVKNVLITYKVTATGITYSSHISLSVDVTPSSAVKISPTGSKIAIDHSDALGSKILYGTFNNSTGHIMLGSSLSVDSDAFEFSPDGNNLYLVQNNNMLYKYEFSTSTLLHFYTASSSTRFETLQLGMDGVIYIPSGFTKKLSKIENPNDFLNPMFTFESVILTRDCQICLPQLVYWHDLPCTPLTLTTEPHDIYVYSNRSNITTKDGYVIDNTGKFIDMHARDFVVLKPDTHIATRAYVWISIEECAEDGPIEIESTMLSRVANILQSNIFSMYPNPAHDRINLTATMGITSITITSLDGMLMYSTKLSGKETSHDVDVNRYSKGIYIVNLTTADGKTESQKLMKN